MKLKKINLVITSLFLFAGCYEQELKPVTEENFPLQVLLDLNAGGTYESEDSYGLEVTFDGGVDEVEDENGNVIAGSPEGTRGPYSQDLTINFAIEDLEGLQLGDDLSIEEVVYNIDECTEGSADFTLNQDGTGSFTIPGGIEVVEVVFSLNEANLDNDQSNDDEKTFSFSLTGIQGDPQDVLLNINNTFEYSVLDDESVYNEWILDHQDPDLLADFLSTFSPVLEDLEALTAEEIDEIKFEFGYEEVTILIVLTETEMVEECGETEEVNVELEIEGKFEVEEGEIEMVLENEDGDEFSYSGDYEIGSGPLMMSMSIEGEDEDGEIIAEEKTIILSDD